MDENIFQWLFVDNGNDTFLISQSVLFNILVRDCLNMLHICV